MSSLIRKVRRNQEKLERLKHEKCFHLGKTEKVGYGELKKHLDNCKHCEYTTMLRFLVSIRGKFRIRKRDEYLLLKYKKWTYHLPLSKEVLEEVEYSADKLLSLTEKNKKFSDIVEEIVDYAMFAIFSGNGVGEIDKNDVNFINRCI